MNINNQLIQVKVMCTVPECLNYNIEMLVFMLIDGNVVCGVCNSDITPVQNKDIL